MSAESGGPPIRDLPNGWKLRVFNGCAISWDPRGNFDFSSLPYAFFGGAARDQAFELIWIYAKANLQNTNNEIIVPTNVVDLHGMDLLNGLVDRLKDHLQMPVYLFWDEDINSYRLHPLAPDAPMLSDIETHKHISENLTLAVDNGVELAAEPRHIPRPPNSFILYRQHHHRAVAEANPGLPNTQISRVIADMWRNETVEVRNNFKELAEERKRLHAIQHPNYQYLPRRPGERFRREIGRLNPSKISALADTQIGQELIEEANERFDGRLEIDGNVVDKLDDLGFVYGPSSTVTNDFPPEEDKFQTLLGQQLARTTVQTVHYEATQGGEFDSDFPMEELLSLEGA